MNAINKHLQAEGELYSELVRLRQDSASCINTEVEYRRAGFTWDPDLIKRAADEWEFSSSWFDAQYRYIRQRIDTFADELREDPALNTGKLLSTIRRAIDELRRNTPLADWL